MQKSGIINLTNRFKLYQDSRGSLWLVEKTGLHRIDLEKGEISDYKLFKSIEFPEAWSIIEDSNYNLWIGTQFGLCRFNIESGQTNVYIPPVVITDLRLFNKSVGVDTSKKGILTKNISYTSQIELAHDQNDLSFEFAALDFTLPSRNQYAYKLEGYQDDRVETDAKNRIATYTNLNPGNYIFRVKGSNNDGIWNEKGASLAILIHKPWWGTTLALCIYSLVLLGAIGGYIRWRLWRLKKEKMELERQIHERTHQIEEQKELLEQQNHQITAHEQLKSRFF